MSHYLRRSVALLGVAILCLSGQGLAQAPNEVEPGTTWVGEKGVTETIGQIMARQAISPPRPLHGPRRIRNHPVRRELPHNPAALKVAQWPPPLGGDESGVGVRPIQRYSPQTVGANYQGVVYEETPGYFPPDTMGAVGPTQFLIGINGLIRVLSKATGFVGSLNADPDVFFQSVRGGDTSDPRVRFDRLSNRWFIVMVDIPNSGANRILIAVSDGPTLHENTQFAFYQFRSDVGTPITHPDRNGFADYPTLGVDANALYIGVNMFRASGGFNTAVFVVRKSSVLSGGPIVVTSFRTLVNASGGMYTPQGVDNSDPTATQGYFIGVDNAQFGELVLRRISNPGGTPTISSNLSLSVPETSLPLGKVYAKGSPFGVATLDDRLMMAQIHKNRLTGVSTLWTAHTNTVTDTGLSDPGGTRNGVRWYEIGDLSTAPTLIQAGTLFDASTKGRSFWMPSLAASGQGHLAIGANMASATERIGIVSVGRLSMDTLGTIQTPTTILTSSFNYDLGPDNTRWGDYSFTSLDPTDDMTIWTVQQYVSSVNAWGIRVAQLKAPPPPPIETLAPTAANTGTTFDITVTGVAGTGNGFYDPDSTYPKHIQAAFSGTGITVNSVTFVTPIQLTLNVTIAADAPTGTRDLTITNPDGQTVIGHNLLIVQPGDFRVTGTILLKDLLLVADPQLLTFDFRTPGQTTALFSRSASIASDGAYTLLGVPNGTYDLAVKGAKWLRKVVPVTVADADVANVNATLIPGDANDDNAVNLFDLGTLAEAFNTVPGDLTWNPQSDFNGDNMVDIFDLAILAEYFNTDGDP